MFAYTIRFIWFGEEWKLFIYRFLWQTEREIIWRNENENAHWEQFVVLSSIQMEEMTKKKNYNKNYRNCLIVSAFARLELFSAIILLESSNFLVFCLLFHFICVRVLSTLNIYLIWLINGWKKTRAKIDQKSIVESAHVAISFGLCICSHFFSLWKNIFTFLFSRNRYKVAHHMLSFVVSSIFSSEKAKEREK